MAIDEREVDAEAELLVAARDVDSSRKGSAAGMTVAERRQPCTSPSSTARLISA